MNISDFIEKTHVDDRFIQRPRIICKDGFSMSVQGSEFHYCAPRSLQNWYQSMEIGFPNRREVLLSEYAENKKALTKTVYGWVPTDIIDMVIEKHGGINEEKTFEQITRQPIKL